MHVCEWWALLEFFFLFKKCLYLLHWESAVFFLKFPYEHLLTFTWLSFFQCYLFGPIWPCMTGSFVPHSAIWLYWNGNFSIFSSFPPSFSLFHMEGLPPDLLDFLVLSSSYLLTSLHILLFIGLALFLQTRLGTVFWLGSWLPPWLSPKFSSSSAVSSHCG